VLYRKQEVVILPDYSKPRVLVSKPSLFAAGKFGVTLTNGLLAGVNTETTPQLPAYLAAAAAFDMAPAGDGDACNAAPVLADSAEFAIGDAR
jgi:hypothetical protein